MSDTTKRIVGMFLVVTYKATNTDSPPPPPPIALTPALQFPKIDVRSWCLAFEWFLPCILICMKAVFKKWIKVQSKSSAVHTSIIMRTFPLLSKTITSGTVSFLWNPTPTSRILSSNPGGPFGKLLTNSL